MNVSKSLPVLLAAASATLLASLTIGATEISAQPRGRAPRGGVVVGRAVPRGVYGPARVYAPGRVYPGRVYFHPRVVGVAPYYPYYYPYRFGISLGFYAGYGYPYGYPYPYYGYGYPYSYGYGSYGYGGYGYGPYGYALPPPSYVSMRPGVAYGGVRIEGAPRDAQVFADGYYVGIVDDFDGTFQHLNLEAGAHQIEIRVAGQAPLAFDVNVQPGQTTTYHASRQ
jgi:hypothetical protein